MSESDQDAPFFIGWESKPAAPISTFLKKTTLVLVAVSLVVAGLTTALQQTVGGGKFDFGNVQGFNGVLFKSPAPMLVADDGTTYYLVAEFKHGLPDAVAEEHHLQHVTLKGTLIGRELDAMIEVSKGSVSAGEGANASPLKDSLIGEVVVRGEIVDSKCHLGVMNPGRFKPHRACAIQCITGGIPPILVARTPEGQLAHYLLVDTDGSAINADVIDYVAEPVEISGTLKMIGDRRVLHIDPGTIKRL